MMLVPASRIVELVTHATAMPVSPAEPELPEPIVDESGRRVTCPTMRRELNTPQNGSRSDVPF
jgi:hypothetical protein